MLIDEAGAAGAGGVGVWARPGTVVNAASETQTAKKRNMVSTYLDEDAQVYPGLPRDNRESVAAPIFDLSQSSARCASLMPARSSAATTRSNSATSGTGPMRTRYILRPAITSSRTNTLPRRPPRNFSAKRSAFAGSEKAPAWMNSGERVNGVPAALGWTGLTLDWAGLPLDWVMA